MASPTPTGPTPPDPALTTAAAQIYNYHHLSPTHPLPPPSPTKTLIFTLCSLDLRVAAHAAALYHAGHGSHLAFSGSVGALTAGRFGGPEAVVFAAVAADLGVPTSAIIVEPRATNTGENVRFTFALLRELGLRFSRFILVQKPYMERRTWATFVKQWPGEGAEFYVTSPPLGWDEYPDGDNPRELVMSIMVGDLVRIKEYPARGFQVEQEIPDEVWAAGQRLIAAGYNQHLP
ncbi:DUF218 domain-containing protein [Lasiosphaeria hispida]|uniref:DUF218 domain-containing protein n=1 Tax=Lasiosphaeria hispida TaxID=260671 RepID=A0AAJ0MDF4_9PEZI|nr:DUF218 domain-containing protein [Lasiosphaeria hispida]